MLVVPACGGDLSTLVANQSPPEGDLAFIAGANPVLFRLLYLALCTSSYINISDSCIRCRAQAPSSMTPADLDRMFALLVEMLQALVEISNSIDQHQPESIQTKLLWED